MALNHANATSATWLQTAAGNYTWTTSANWSDGNIPNASGDSAVITTALSGNETITVENVTIGSLTIGSGSTTYATTVRSGTLTLDNGGSGATIVHLAGSGADVISSAVVLTSGGLTIVGQTSNVLGITGGITGTGNLTLDGGGLNILNINNTGSITCITSSGTSSTLFLGAAIGANVTDFIINRGNGETVALSGSNTAFVGTVHVTQGTLRISGTNALNQNNVVYMNSNSSARLDLQSSVTIAGLSGSGIITHGSTVGTTTLTVAGSGNYTFNSNGSYDSTTSSVALKIAMGASGSQTLTGEGTGWKMTGGVSVVSGNLILGGTNVFAYTSGTVAVNGGRLSSSVANANIGTNATNSLMTTLDIEGGAVDINGDSVGSFTLGNTTKGGDFLMSSGTLELTLNSAESYDQIIGTSAGTFTLSGGDIVLSSSSGIDYSSTYQIFEGFSSGSVSDVTITGYDTSSYMATLSNDGSLSFTAVPEPGTWAMLVGGMGVLMGFQKLRRGEGRRA